MAGSLMLCWLSWADICLLSAGEAAGEWHLASGSANFRTELIEIEI
jgi:hypothetical protein